MGVTKQYIKDGVVRSFNIVNGKVCTTITIGCETVCNPTIEQFETDGWREYTPPTPPAPEPYIPTYAEFVEKYIREHGYPTYGAELAVINNYAEDPATYLEAWQTYMGVRHDAKEWAEEQPHKEDAL